MPLELHRVVLGHPSLVLEAQYRFQAQFGVQGPEGRPWVLWGNTEAAVKSRQNVLQHPVGFLDAAGLG